jgi:3-(methylthio)propanoyl-CoA dehydrogenase
VQGRVAGSTEAGLAIIGHADVRRMLMTMRSQIEAMRHLIYLNGKAIDDSRYALTPEARSAATELADLLTPMSKAWCTDLGNEVCSLGVQIFGGMGFCEDTGAAQLYRDVRIAAIYEGTNGIQALDLFGRKLPMRDGAVVRELIETMRNDLKTLDGGSLSTLREDLSAGIDALEQAVRWMLSAGRAEILDGMSGATPFLRLFATVVGGWLMARQAVEATKAGIDDTYNAAKVATAEFFLDQILPTGTALLSQVTATAKPLYVISNEALTSC